MLAAQSENDIGLGQAETTNTPEVFMAARILLYLSAALPLFWEVAHLFPTRSVVRRFGDISLDNQRIIRMEWIIEGASLTFTGSVIASATYIDHTNIISKAIYWIYFISFWDKIFAISG